MALNLTQGKALPVPLSEALVLVNNTLTQDFIHSLAPHWSDLAILIYLCGPLIQHLWHTCLAVCQ